MGQNDSRGSLLSVRAVIPEDAAHLSVSSEDGTISCLWQGQSLKAQRDSSATSKAFHFTNRTVADNQVFYTADYLLRNVHKVEVSCCSSTNFPLH